ncbi:MAG: hypothetical protein WD360_04560 [Nitriliruptoraceae bacterium]
MTTVGKLAAITTIRVPPPGWDPDYQIAIFHSADGYIVGYLADDTTPPVGTALTRQPDRDGIAVFSVA